MSKKWTMRLIDDLNIPHWIIEEEVVELRDTRKRVGFCDSQEDAELIIAAPKLEATADRRGELILKREKYTKVCPFCNTRYHTEDCRWNNEVKMIKEELE